MPELPEVETVARTLAPAVTGRSLVSVSVLNPGTWQGGIPAGAVCAGGVRLITGTGRRGKVLLVHFAPQNEGVCMNGDKNALSGLAFHLKMSGCLFVYPQGAEPGKHTRVVFDLSDGTRLFFDDARKFGYARAVSPAEQEAWAFWQKLGPEPLTLDDDSFVRLFEHKSGAIKALLLNQEIIAGIGNIYADESLFRAGIHPSAPGSAIGGQRLCGLRRALVDVLEESIQSCGSSIRDYRTARGEVGAFQNTFRVYGRGKESCMQCGEPLSRIKVAGRTTVFCPRCQPGT